MNYLKICSLLLALLVLGAGSAEAQTCVAKAASPNVRAEGMTEQIGTITLRCRGARGGTDLGFGTSDVDKLEIAVTLNTEITNELTGTNDNMIENIADVSTHPTVDDDPNDTTTRSAVAGYDDGGVVLTARALNNLQGATGPDLDDSFMVGSVSDDLTTVTWKVDSEPNTDGVQGLADFNVDPVAPGGTVGDDNHGFELTIAGLRADASAVGDGGDIMATVTVNGSEVGSYEAASVMNGLEVTVDDAEGPECNDTTATAKITLKEGYNKNAFMAGDMFTVTFRNIPEGVSVMVPAMTAALDAEHEGADLLLVLDEGGPGDGVGDPNDDGMAMVELTASGMGSVMYTIGADPIEADSEANVEADPDNPSVDSGDYQEWVDLNVTFKWDGGDVMANTDAMVYVSFYPTGGSSIPRFVGDGDADMPLTIKDCIGTLTFPFVSSASGYDTGIVVSNTADGAGSCTASYSGSDDTMTSPVIEGDSHWIFLVSTHMQDYTGRLEVECEFTGIDGYAQINDHMGNANGYLPRGVE